MSTRTVWLALLALLCSAGPTPAVSQEGSPAGPIPPKILEARRQRLLEELAGAPAILSSSGPRGEYAQDSDYREDNGFFYLTGLEAPGGWLLFNAYEKGQATLYLPPRSPGSERWTGPKVGPGEEARRATGLEDIRSLERLEGELESWLAGEGSGGRVSPDTLLVSFGDARFEEVLGSLLPSGAFPSKPLAPFLSRLRLVKDEEEIRRLRRAVEITGEAHRELWRVAEPGLGEYQLEAALEYVFRASGAERVGFPSIVGSGPNSVILHYDENRRILEDGDLVVVDIGAEFGYYTADLSRTFPANGRFNSRQAALYELVLGTRGAALDVIRPGATMSEVNQAARSFLQTHSGDLCGEPSCAPYLIHGVSHWLGMDVHDVGSGRAAFTPGMVLTLEPGLYLPEEDLGIRIEDDVLVTENGCEVLSADLPRDVSEIEAIMREDPQWVRGGSAPSVAG